MIIKIPYGKEMLDLDVGDRGVDVCSGNILELVDNQEELLKIAIENPIESKRIKDIAVNKKDVCIVINDITRPTPSKLILKSIFRELEEAGMDKSKIKILVANGNHRPTTRAELISVLGEDYVNEYKIINHNAKNDDELTYLGETPLGVPIHVSSYLAKADMKILTGTIRPHQSAGYSGGRKSVLPGVAGLASIKKHHFYPILPLSPQLGVIENNTFHEESLLGAKFVGIDFIVNVIENSHGHIMDVVAGDLEAAHKRGVEKCTDIWTYSVSKKVDIVVTSPGGYPKDINLHQSQKAIAPCELVLEEGGVIILVAECSDGPGEIPNWFKNEDSPQAVVDRFFRGGWSPKAHAKPFLLARPLSKFNVIIVCEGIEKKVLESMFMIYVDSIESAFDKALELTESKNPSILVLPYAGDVIPIIKQ